MDDEKLNAEISRLAFPRDINSGNWKVFDFKDWNDLMPLVVKHKISLQMLLHNRPNWMVNPLWKGKGERIFNTDPQRALAECLLKELEWENARRT
jgi:hypothetical protein